MEANIEINDFDNLDINFDHVVNSSKDAYKGCILLVNTEDSEQLNHFVEAGLSKEAEMIITSKYCDIESEKVIKFENFDAVFNHALTKMLPKQHSLNFFGITGTNGKTTTGHYLSQLLGEETLFIGTTGYELFKDVTNEVHLTTPKLFNIFKLLRGDEYKDIKNIILEVSSHALDQNRLKGIKFLISGFTNLSQDHLDYHKTIDEYFLAKQKLFDKELSSQYVYVDEKWGKDLNAVIDNKSYSVGISEDNDLVLTSVEKNLNSTIVNFMVENNEFSVELPITGPKLELNYLLAVGMAYFSNQASMEKIVMNSRLLNNPEGRFENISFNENDIYIDYAHTPEAISEAIDIVKDKYSMVIVVLGAGGNRDSGKRKLMGKASNNADKVIITNDNPRKENPMQIAKDILNGVDLNKDVEIILDRQLAIRKGIELLQGDSALLVLGKGHEKTQELEKGLVDFQDSLVIQEIIKELK